MSFEPFGSAERRASGRWVAFISRLGKPGIVSIILLLLTVGVWIRSYGRNVVEFEAGRFFAFIHDGEAIFRLQSAEPVSGTSTIWRGWIFMGLGTYRMIFSKGYVRSVDFPIWLLAIVLFFISARAVRRAAVRMRTDRRRASGHCLACGYDLRGTTGSCPECGSNRERDVVLDIERSA